MPASESLLDDALTRAAAAEEAEGRSFRRDPQKTLQQGCSTTLVAALDPEIEKESGKYLVNGSICSEQPPESSTSLESQKLLWGLSEKLVGEKFDW